MDGFRFRLPYGCLIGILADYSIMRKVAVPFCSPLEKIMQSDEDDGKRKKRIHPTNVWDVAYHFMGWVGVAIVVLAVAILINGWPSFMH